MPRDMSWLSPKRRRTTTALPTVNGIRNKNGVDGQQRPLSPSPRFTSPKPVLPSPTLKQRASRTFSTASVTSAAATIEEEGNLFYAYARRADELHPRYLLTFASAQVAGEWWSLIQSCYPETTRPGPQLFSFKADDFLEQAWKHAALAHLQPKWMYIQYGDSTRGATQGIIPIQDAHGNILGGASVSSEQRTRGEPKRDVMNGASMLEERFEKMMEAVERNTEQISALTDARSSEDNKVPATKTSASVNGTADTSSSSDLSSHLDRISQLLEQNCAHVASLAQRQADNEQRMREMIEAQHARETATAEQPDMSQLTSHLDRIQRLMERTAHSRKDSARDIRTSPPRVDMSPLTFRLEKVLSAVEQNSEFVKELLQDKEESKASHPSQQIEIDLSPLAQRLDDLLDAQEAKSTRDQEAYAQMNHRLDKVIEAQHKAVERGPFDVSLLSQRLDEILSVHRDVATTSLAEPLDAIRAASEQNSSHLLSLLEAHQESGSEQHGSHDLEPLRDHLEALRATTEHNSDTMIELLESLAVGRQAVTENNKSALTPFDDDRTSFLSERQQEGPGIGDSKFLLSALTSHLSKIQAVTESNAKAVRSVQSVIESNTNTVRSIQSAAESNNNAVRSSAESNQALQRSLTTAVSDTSASIRALAVKHKDLAAQVAVREGQVREVVRSQADMVECVRDLAKTIKAQEKAACNHVVIPPPRKTNRKVVGFVYDAKDMNAQ
ncbi:hypothetical protein MBLNU13_g03563t1 [Cladosporium sp. NU13]